MRRRSPPVFVVVGGLLALVVVIYGVVQSMQTETPPSAEEFMQKAEESPSIPEQERAVLALAATGPAAEPHLRRLLVQSQSPEVRAAAIEGLNSLHARDSMPQILAALDDPSVKVRGRAGAAASRMLGADFFYRADDPPERRAAAARAMRSCYETLMKNPTPEQKSSKP